MVELPSKVYKGLVRVFSLDCECNKNATTIFTTKYGGIVVNVWELKPYVRWKC